MQILKLRIEEIVIPPSRQRVEVEGEALGALMESIEAHGLLHPIVVRENGSGYTLVAGGRRLQALSNLGGLQSSFRCGGSNFPVGYIPCVSLGSLDPLAAESEIGRAHV